MRNVKKAAKLAVYEAVSIKIKRDQTTMHNLVEMAWAFISMPKWINAAQTYL